MGATRHGKEDALGFMGCDEQKKGEGGGLGFRDLHLFNLAMLARQGWRLIQDPDSLCGQILRAKYGSLLTA